MKYISIVPFWAIKNKAIKNMNIWIQCVCVWTYIYSPQFLRMILGCLVVIWLSGTVFFNMAIIILNSLSNMRIPDASHFYQHRALFNFINSSGCIVESHWDCHLHLSKRCWKCFHRLIWACLLRLLWNRCSDVLLVFWIVLFVISWKI